MPTTNVTPINRTRRLHHIIETRQRAAGRVYDPPAEEMELAATDLATDGRGNVLAMPEVPVRACFGDGVTFLRNGNNGICVGCPARGACLHLVNERVRSDERQTRLLAAWLDVLATVGDDEHTAVEWSNFVDAWARMGWRYGGSAVAS